MLMTAAVLMPSAAGVLRGKPLDWARAMKGMTANAIPNKTSNMMIIRFVTWAY